MGTIPFLSQVEPENRRYMGAFIRYLRQRIFMTQTELSLETGYSVQTISRIENGKANAMSVAGRDILTALGALHGMEGVDMFDAYREFMCGEQIIESPLQ